MLDTSQLAVFVAASWILILTPGPDMIYVLTRGAAQGKAAGLASAFGVTLGILVHTLLAAFGLTVVLQSSMTVFLFVKYLGAGYLIYLGVKSLRDRSTLELGQDQRALSQRQIFVQGVLSNVLNPKIALFFLAFLPQFVNPAVGSTAVQMVLLGLLFALFGVVFLSVLGYTAGRLGRWLSQNDGLTRSLRWITGSVLVGLGVRLALSERR